VTISSTATHVMSPAGRIGDEEAKSLRAEAGQGPGDVAVDILAPHLPRGGDWADATGARVGALRAPLPKIGRAVPIHLSEERRADDTTAIAPDAYARAFASAQQAGAAGWVFHTTAGYDLRTTSFLSALRPQERAGLERLKK